jgi:hypothetical protein
MKTHRPLKMNMRANKNESINFYLLVVDKISISFNHNCGKISVLEHQILLPTTTERLKAHSTSFIAHTSRIKM